MAKGSQFERDMCREFSLWWTNKKRDDVFWRTSQSGGRATQRMKSGKTTSDSYGDMMATDEEGKPFTRFILTEFKKGYTKDLGALIVIDGNQKEPILKTWLKKNEVTRKSSGRQYSMIVFQRNYKKTCIVLDQWLFGLLESYVGEWYRTDLLELFFVDVDIKVVIVSLSAFFKWCTAEDMKLVIEEQP